MVRPKTTLEINLKHKRSLTEACIATHAAYILVLQISIMFPFVGSGLIPSDVSFLPKIQH